MSERRACARRFMGGPPLLSGVGRPGGAATGPDRSRHGAPVSMDRRWTSRRTPADPDSRPVEERPACPARNSRPAGCARYYVLRDQAKADAPGSTRWPRSPSIRPRSPDGVEPSGRLDERAPGRAEEVAMTRSFACLVLALLGLLARPASAQPAPGAPAGEPRLAEARRVIDA